MVSTTICLGVYRIACKSRWIVGALFVASVVCICQTQASDNPDSDPAGQHTESVLVQDDDDYAESPALRADANGTAKVDDNSAQPINQSTFTAQPLPSAPQMPSTLKSNSPAAAPNQQDSAKVKPFVNELRGETIAPPSNQLTEEGTQALGTFATTKQAWQDQAVKPPVMRPPTNVPNPTVPSVPQAYGNRNTGAQSQLSPPEGSTRSANFSAGSGLQRFPNNNPDQPSQWKQETGDQLNRSSDPGFSSRPAVASQMPAGTQNDNTRPSANSFGSSVAMPPVRPSNPVQNAYSTQSTDGNQVRATGFNQPIGASKAGTELAKALMARYATANSTGALPGKPIKLIDVLRQPIPAEQRKPMIHQYWTTYYDWTMWVSEQENAQWLKRVPTPANIAEKAMLDVARADAQNRILAAKIQLGKSQSKLIQYLPNWNSGQLPIPNDLPLIQKYKTNYEIYKSYQLMPANLRGIDRMLPDLLALIVNRAQTVQLAKDAAEQVLSALSSRQARVSDAIDIARQSRYLNKDLVASVISYNQAIADYSLTVARGYQTPEQVEAMLIAKPKTDQSNVAQRFNGATNQQQRRNPNGRPASNGSQIQNVGSPTTAPPTLIGSRPGQQSGRANGGSSNFDLNAQGAFQGRSSGQANSVIGGSVAPATPVGGRSSQSGGAFGPQLPGQQTQNQPQSVLGSGTRSANSAFGPGIETGR